MIPITKFVVIIYLALLDPLPRHASTSTPASGSTTIVEFIGRWSMIDVFVVAILTALVQLGFLASINPGPAAVFFALSVAFTMLSAQSLDPRLIWDSAEPRDRRPCLKPTPPEPRSSRAPRPSLPRAGSRRSGSSRSSR